MYFIQQFQKKSVREQAERQTSFKIPDVKPSKTKCLNILNATLGGCFKQQNSLESLEQNSLYLKIALRNTESIKCDSLHVTKE